MERVPLNEVYWGLMHATGVILLTAIFVVLWVIIIYIVMGIIKAAIESWQKATDEED